jgi:TolB-like protein/tetratricopeptide (TPR) repeat protein
VYSLGCVLQEMLTGQASLGARPLAGTGRQGEPGTNALPPGLEALVAAMMSRDPATRHSTGDHLLAAIDEARRLVNVHRTPMSWVRRTTAFIAVAVLLVAVALWVTEGWRTRAIRSLAVLPPQDLSGDTTRQYLADGIHDALIGELAGVGALRVISRTSANRYRGSTKSVPEIARELGVDAVVEVTTTRSGDHVTVRVHVIRARPSERDLGADTFERELRGVLGLYKDATRAIARRLSVPIAPDELNLLATSRDIDPVTYDTYLRGMAALHGGATVEDFTRGLALLNDAIARDSTEPLPWAGVALAYDQIGHLSGQLPDAFARARAAAERAQRLGGVLAETDAALAQTRLYDDWNPRAADSLFVRAIRRNPSIPDARSHYGWSLLLSGNTDSAMASLQRAEEVDPLTGQWAAFTASAASWSGRPDVAHAAIRRALAVDPELPIAQYVYATILALDGDSAGAIAAARRAAAGNRVWKFSLGYVLARAGQNEEARGIAAELSREPDGMTAWGLAEIHAALGEPDQAFEWLEISRARRWNWMPRGRLQSRLRLAA